MEAFIQEYNDMNQLYRLRLIIIIALGAVCVILIIMVIVLLRKKAGGNGSDHPHDPGVQNPGGSRRQPDALAQHLPERAARERFGQNTSENRPERREAAEEYFILCALYQYVPAVDRRSDRPLRGY